MSKMKRTLLVSCAIILLCMTIIVGVTYSLFTDRVSVRNHLKAGNLNIELWRTNLDYSVLNTESGYMDNVNVSTPVNFTSPTGENVFGLKADEDVYIVPGSYFDADMEIRNSGNVAFTYTFSIVLNGAANDLSDQLYVTVLDENGNEVSGMSLSGYKNQAKVFEGQMDGDVKTKKFSIKVEFLDDVKENADLKEGETPMNNNNTMSQGVDFDFILEAVQATTKN